MATATSTQHRMQLLVATLVSLMCVSAAAFRPTAFEAISHPARILMQDSLSNSNGCSATIPKCEEGACVVRNIMGAQRWACLRCIANYEPVVDASGQQNIIQCVCPKGFFENSTAATSCTRCPTNSYCPGGDKTENPTSRGSVLQCGSSLVTRNTGARSAVDCVAPAGYAMTAPTVATPCARSEYAPAFNRLNKCLRCQGGLEEAATSALTPEQRLSKKAVCQVPPGKYVSQGLVRTCPQGFYRENYESYDAAVAQKCVACNRGITTAGAGAKLASECNKVVAGYGIQNLPAINGSVQEIPVLQQNATNGLPNATVCDLGYYSTGGFCAQCPSATVTRVLGAKSIEECAVPPGYYLAGGSMTLCGSGSFREGWVMYSDPKAASCTPCGDGIRSEARELDENPLAANSSRIRATSASCYIEAGQGMVAQGRNAYIGMDCPINTYGASGKVYGWAAAPCKPCPRNMITDQIAGATSSDACINPGGYGYASEGASRCSPGFYAAKGSRKPCKRCPDGRTTEDNPERQQILAHCDVTPGWGVVGGSLPPNGNIFEGSLAGMDEGAILALSVLKCPTGYWGGGDTIAARCVKCPEGSTTKEAGSTELAECSVCLPGKGRANSTAPCLPCDYGSYQPGGLAECITCPNATFYSPVDGVGPSYTSIGSTFTTGATGIEWCVPMQSQLSPEAGQAYFSLELSKRNDILTMIPISNSTSLQHCLSQCGAFFDQCCFAQWDAAAKVCTTATLPPADELTVGPQIFYKLPPSELSSASSIRDEANVTRAHSVAGIASRRVPGTERTVTLRQTAAPRSTSSDSITAQSTETPVVRSKTLASGLYARCSLPDADQAAAWQQVGSPLGLDARTFAQGTGTWRPAVDLNECQELCDNSNVCWGGIYDETPDGNFCMFRGGVDALKTRSFFALPAPGTAPNMLNPGANSYYYTFTSNDPAALQNTTKLVERLTLFSEGITAALQLLLPASGTLTVTTFEPSMPPGATGLEIGFSIDGLPLGSALNLDTLFSDNTTTTTLVARTLLQLCMDKGGDSSDLLFTGLSIFSSNGERLPLGTDLVVIDACVLIGVADYCGTNGAGACSLNVCTCQQGWSGPQCTQNGTQNTGRH